MLALVGAGLLGSGVAVTTLRHQLLVRNVDQLLIDASTGWALEPRHDPEPGTSPNPARPPSDFYVQGVDAQGVEWEAINDNKARPALPANNDVGSVPVTIGSVGGTPVQWRALTVRGPSGDLITVALDLADVQYMVRSLIWLQVGIGAVILSMLGVAGYFTVQRSLQPLVEIEKTAIAIADGQLERLVPQADPRTEVGQLALALNGMLTQIQRAVAASDESAEKARESEERMRRFITDASHELRTPLTTIRGFAELYRQGAAGDVEMLMSRIESESRRMGGLVDDLLLLAQLDAQRPIDRSRVDLLGLASDAVHDAQSLAPERPIVMEVLDGPGTPEVLGDEARLRQVLANLVANALQHAPSPARVTVRVGTEAGEAIVEVADEGPGMSEEDARRVFERFYRADSSRTRASGGAGLGLPIVESLVRAHGGRVTISTAPGRGCCFRVSLPRIVETDLSPTAPALL